MANNESFSALEFSRRIFDNALDWYKNADSKAQIILTLDGAFLAFLTSFIFIKPADFSEILSCFGWETWLFLGLMCVTYTGSIVSVIMCLWSRIYSEKDLDEDLKNGSVDPKNFETFKPQFTFFFQYISKLDADQLAKKLSVINENFEIEALAHEVRELSENVMKKHYWVNCGFALAGISFLLLLGAVISYVIRTNS